MRQIAMMLAMDKNKLIGKDNDMPWHIPGDLPYFQSVTTGKPVIMGRKTFDSLGKPLPGRVNIVVTRNREWQADGAVVTNSLEQAIEVANQLETRDNEIVIIGGAGLCREAMPVTTRLYLTYIDEEFEGDVWFDSFQWSDWHERSRDDLDSATTGGYSVSRLILEKPAQQAS